MRKARFAVLAATSIFFLHTQADRASAMPIASPSAIGLAASESGATLQVRYVARHHRYGAWRAPYERQYISHRYDLIGTTGTVSRMATGTIRGPIGDWVAISIPGTCDIRLRRSPPDHLQALHLWA
jgi:hypothetical protein